MVKVTLFWLIAVPAAILSLSESTVIEEVIKKDVHHQEPHLVEQIDIYKTEPVVEERIDVYQTEPVVEERIDVYQTAPVVEERIDVYQTAPVVEERIDVYQTAPVVEEKINVIGKPRTHVEETVYRKPAHHAGYHHGNHEHHLIHGTKHVTHGGYGHHANVVTAPAPQNLVIQEKQGQVVEEKIKFKEPKDSDEDD